MNLKDVRAAGWVRDLDVELVRRLEGQFGRPEGEDENVRVLLALASAATDSGDVCLPLDASVLEETLERCAEEEGLKEMGVVLEAAKSGVAELGKSGLAGAPEQRRPFVVEEGRLYLRRYWRYEEETATALLKLATDSTFAVDAAEVDTEVETETAGTDLTNEQEEALSEALKGRFTVITGGPGTGKTTVAAHLLTILMKRGGTKVVAAAPTGKAAARLKDSLASKMGAKSAEAVEAKTVDRLLGWKEGPYFKHDQNNPLLEDVVVVDETSMLDLPKAAKLLQALGNHTRLVLLGDKNQLSSVDPGNVMAEICGSTRLAGRVKKLEESWRFPNGSDVHVLAAAVLDGKKEEAWLRLTGGGDVQQHDVAGMDDEKKTALRERLAKGYVKFAAAVKAWKTAPDTEKAEKAKDVLDALGTYRVLCVTRHGPQGTETVNREAAARLFPGRGKGENYDGRVVMVVKNNPDIGLYNGDVGVVLGDKAWFPVAPGGAKQNGGGDESDGKPLEGKANGKVRPVPVFLLPEHETAFAMTVHKSQGSEFDDVTVLLPEKGCKALLRRELIYTAITRTKKTVDIWCTKAAFDTAVGNETKRNTGLREKLDREAGER